MFQQKLEDSTNTIEFFIHLVIIRYLILALIVVIDRDRMDGWNFETSLYSMYLYYWSYCTFSFDFSRK